MLIPFRTLFKKYNYSPKAVLHAGANFGQEAKEYFDLGITKGVFIEAIPDLFRRLKRHLLEFPADYKAINACITDKDYESVQFHLASNDGQSSSILELGTHAKVHPEVRFTGHIMVETITLKTLLPDLKDYEFINFDLQGAELLALKGMGNLNHVTGAYLEVNRDELYKGCALVDEIDEYMAKWGLKRVETLWAGNTGWGDCFMIKNNLL